MLWLSGRGRLEKLPSLGGSFSASHICLGFVGGAKTLEKGCGELFRGWIVVKRESRWWSLHTLTGRSKVVKKCMTSLAIASFILDLHGCWS